uniref:Peptidase M50 domain-containing protein n=1 Tax=Kalanchoe fedtschenkoi TaxID=63787 RepID=A0A7N0UBL3_KALFE
MSSVASFCLPISQCGGCRGLTFHPIVAASSLGLPCRRGNKLLVSRAGNQRRVFCRVNDSDASPDSSSDEDKEKHKDVEVSAVDPQASTIDHGESTGADFYQSQNVVSGNEGETKSQGVVEDADIVEVATGSPLPGLKQQQFGEFERISKEVIDILKDQVFGFDTFFVTSQEPYEGGVLFKGNLRGTAAKSYEKITKRLQDKFDEEYKLFLLINPEDDKPVAVVVPQKILQPEKTAVPEWFAAGAFGLVTVFTLLLRNVPALQSNLLSSFDNLELLKDGLPGALVTALILGVHEISHIIVAQKSGIRLGVPYFVPSWQIGSFGAITRIINIVPKREDLLKVAAAGPLAGFSLGLVLMLLGFFIPPTDGIGVVVDSSVFHESLLAGGIAKLLLGDVLKEGTPISVNPLILWAWAGLLINAINSIPAGELDGGRIAFSIWGRKASSRLTAASIALLGLSSLFNDVAFYWVVLIFFLQRGPIAPLSEEITDPDQKYVALGITVLVLGLLVCLPYPFSFSSDVMTSF